MNDVPGTAEAARAAGALPAAACHEVLFAAEERGEYGYDLAAFREDLAAFFAGGGGGGEEEAEEGEEGEEGGGGGGGCAEGERAGPPWRLTCEEALAFLADAQ